MNKSKATKPVGSFILRHDQLERLRRMAEQEERSQSYLVRVALDIAYPPAKAEQKAS